MSACDTPSSFDSVLIRSIASGVKRMANGNLFFINDIVLRNAIHVKFDKREINIMFSFAGLQVHRYKQRVLTRRARATATTNLNLPNFNDWHLVKVWSVGSGGRGAGGINGTAWTGYAGGGGGGIASGRYQADPLVNRTFNCNVGTGNSDDTLCTFYDQRILTTRTLTGGGGTSPGAGTKPGGGGGFGSGGQVNVRGGRGGDGAGRGGGGGGIGLAAGQDSTGGNNGSCGDGATGNDVNGIHDEMTYWGYAICCGGKCNQRNSFPGDPGCGGGGCGANRTANIRGRADQGGVVGGGGGGALQANAAASTARIPGQGNRGEVFILY